MKEVVLSLAISSDEKIEAYFPNMQEKFNFYYEPSENLHKFDEITIAYHSADREIILCKNELGDSVRCMSEKIKRAQNSLVELPSILSVGTMVYALNEKNKESANEFYSDIRFENFWLWSARNRAQTFMYTHEGTLYLEIGPLYPWLFADPEPTNPDYITYEEFIKDYKPLAIVIITPAMQTEWKKECIKLLESIDAR